MDDLAYTTSAPGRSGSFNWPKAIIILVGLILLYPLLKAIISALTGGLSGLGAGAGSGTLPTAGSVPYNTNPYSPTVPVVNVSSQPTSPVSTSAWQPGSTPSTSALPQIRQRLMEAVTAAMAAQSPGMMVQHKGAWPLVNQLSNMNALLWGQMPSTWKLNQLKAINLLNDRQHVIDANATAASHINEAIGLGVTDITVDGSPSILQLPVYELIQEQTIKRLADRFHLSGFQVGVSGGRASLGDLRRGLEFATPVD